MPITSIPSVTTLTTIPAIVWWLLGGLAALCTIITVSACILAGRCDRGMRGRNHT